MCCRGRLLPHADIVYEKPNGKFRGARIPAVLPTDGLTQQEIAALNKWIFRVPRPCDVLIVLLKSCSLTCLSSRNSLIDVESQSIRQI